MLDHWSYDDISVFIAVVEQGSFVGASNRLGLPTSTVSRRLSKLEADLDVKLLERTSRKMALTEKGRAFFQRVSPLFQQLKEDTQQLIESKNRLAGKIKLSAPIFLSYEVLSDWLVEFQILYPDIDIGLQVGNQYDDIIDDEIDLAIRIGPLQDSQFIAQFLCTPKFQLCASPAYLESHQTIQSPQELQDHRAIFVQHQPTVWVLSHNQTGQHCEVVVHGREYSNDFRLACKATEAGLGIACLPSFHVERSNKIGLLVPILTEYTVQPKGDIYAVYPSKKYLSKKTQILLQFLKEKFAHV